MAAGIAGVDAVWVQPFNAKTQATDFSESLAINVQRVVLEEGRLGKVMDATSGSWYMEHLTDALAEKSWQLFLDIVEKGEAWFLEQVAETAAISKEDEATGKEVILGVNKYKSRQ
jgi:methylmalonyl-CoA mutase